MLLRTNVGGDGDPPLLAIVPLVLLCPLGSACSTWQQAAMGRKRHSVDGARLHPGPHSCGKEGSEVEWWSAGVRHTPPRRTRRARLSSQADHLRALCRCGSPCSALPPPPSSSSSSGWRHQVRPVSSSYLPAYKGGWPAGCGGGGNSLIHCQQYTSGWPPPHSCSQCWDGQWCHCLPCLSKVETARGVLGLCSSGGSSPRAGGQGKPRPASTLTAIRQRMTAAPLGTPPASPARAVLPPLPFLEHEALPSSLICFIMPSVLLLMMVVLHVLTS